MANSINQLANAIVKELVAYDKDVAKKVQKETRKAALETVRELQQTSPQKTGKYASGWEVKKDGKGYRVYNKTSAQLTHLLEFGHAKISGGRVPPVKVHIKPAEQHAIESLETTLRDVLGS